jgi:hypothetical protein
LSYPFHRESFKVGGKPHKAIHAGTVFTADNLKDFSRQQNNMTKEIYQTFEKEQIEETKKEIDAQISLLEAKQARLKDMIERWGAVVEQDRRSLPPSARCPLHDAEVTNLNRALAKAKEERGEWQIKRQDLEKFVPDEKLTDIIVNLLSYDAVDRCNPFQTDTEDKKAKKAKTKEGGGKKKRKRKLKISYRKFRKKKTKTKRKTKRKIKRKTK